MDTGYTRSTTKVLTVITSWYCSLFCIAFEAKANQKNLKL